MKTIGRVGLWKTVVVVFSIAALSWIAWQQLTKIRGSQIVTFTPAPSDCGVMGKLRYCRYRSQGGANGDTV